MRFILITLVLFLYLPLNTIQGQKENRWGISAGWTEGYIGDQHASPLLYHSDVLNVGGIFQSRGPFFFEITLEASVGTNQAQNLRRRTGTLLSTADLYGEVESYEFVVNPFISRINGKLQVRGLWSINNHHQIGFNFKTRYIMAGIAADSWQYAQIDLGPTYQYTYPIGNGRIEANASLPLLAGIVRPNFGFDPSLSDETNYFKGYVRTGSSIASINQFLNPEVRAGYLHTLKSGKEIGAYYGLQWTSFPEPRPVRMLEHGFDLVYFF